MTPKEKAEELVKRFTDYSHDKDSANVCAYIAIEEVLSIYKKLPLETLEWYVQVQKEIIKL